MRMHRKRNLEGRLAACSDLLIARGRPCLNLKRAAEEYRALFDFAELFQNDHPVHLEIGCGYGGFLAEIAKRNPDINFLAVEVCSNVILAAMERVKESGLKNVRFLNIPAEILSCYLPEKSVGRIYLNFSTPLPRSGYANQRLTAPRFLEIYKKLLQTGGEIRQKTDSEPFFDFSLEQYLAHGFRLERLTRDLHASEYASDNIITEYEKNFSEKGMPIFSVTAVLSV